MFKNISTIVCLISVLLAITGCCFTSDCDCGGGRYDSNIRIAFMGVSDSNFIDEESIEILDSNGTKMMLMKSWYSDGSTITFHSGTIGYGRYALRFKSEGENVKIDLNIRENHYSDSWCKPEGQINSGHYQSDTVRIKSTEFHCLTAYILPECE